MSCLIFRVLTYIIILCVRRVCAVVFTLLVFVPQVSAPVEEEEEEVGGGSVEEEEEVGGDSVEEDVVETEEEDGEDFEEDEVVEVKTDLLPQ